MTYANQDASLEAGRPVLLVEFERDGATTRLCTYPEDLTKDGKTWTASAIEVPRMVTTSHRANREEIAFKVPLADSFGLSELVHSDTRSTAKIYRTHLSDGAEEVSLRWQGYIEGARINRDVIEIQCVTGRKRLIRSGAYGRAERTCRNTLYGTNCGLTAGDWLVAVSAVNVSGNVVTLAAAVPSGEEQFANGLIQHDSPAKEVNVYSLSGTTLTLYRADSALTAAIVAGVNASGSYAMNLLPGCAKNLTSCAYFSNIINFRGYPYMPDRGAFEGSSIA